MKTVDQIIAACGGPRAVIAARGVTAAALRKWRQFGVIPAKHHLGLIRLSGGSLALEDLAPAEPPQEAAA